jgi:mRNA-degrading endonuclease YafQ of YafQ-DinJ toxin-antitoxin module
MRWFEILNEVVFKNKDEEFTVFMTQQFKKTYNNIIRSQPRVKEDFEKFIDFKREYNIKAFGNRDNIMAPGSGMSGLWHYHIIYGKVIVIYSIDRNHIELYAIGEHILYDTPARVLALKRFIDSLTQDDFEIYQQYSMFSISSEKMNEVVELIYSLIPDEIDLLTNYLKTGKGLFSEILYDTINAKNENDIDLFHNEWLKKFKISFEKYIQQTIGKY